MIKAYYPGHAFYAEEEHNNFVDADDVWIVDPISGTRVFLNGWSHYGMVVSYVHKHAVQFAAVYDPSAATLYTAQRGKGAYRNGERISVHQTVSEKPKVVLSVSQAWNGADVTHDFVSGLDTFDVDSTPRSHAVNDCLVVSGEYDGVVALAKDSFPYFAGSLIVQEAGGYYTNIDCAESISFADRVFFGGNKRVWQGLKAHVEKLKIPLKLQTTLFNE